MCITTCTRDVGRMLSASGTMRLVKRCTTRIFGGSFLSATSLSMTSWGMPLGATITFHAVNTKSTSVWMT